MLLFTYFSRDLLAAFEFLVLLANFATLVPFLTSGVDAAVRTWGLLVVVAGVPLYILKTRRRTADPVVT